MRLPKMTKIGQIDAISLDRLTNPVKGLSHFLRVYMLRRNGYFYEKIVSFFARISALLK